MTLVARDVGVAYGARVALRPVSIELARGELVALVGPNGAGKTSLLKALAGLVPHVGSVSWAGTALDDLAPRARARSIAYLPQTPGLHWPMTVHDLVALGRLPHRGFGAAPSSDDRDATAWALEQTETTEFAERGVDRLSSGERARVLLARALAVRAPVLLVDEPIAMLDPYHQLQVMAMLRAYADGSAKRVENGGGAGNGAIAGDADRDPRALVVAVLHDLSLAARFCTRVLLLDGGTVVIDDRPERALNAQALERHYRVQSIVTTHEGEPLILPWRRLER
jgi:iron complex transport system ATP-binding protein